MDAIKGFYKRHPVWSWVIIVVVGLGIIGAAVPSSEDDSGSSDSGTPAAQTEDAPAEEPAAEEKPAEEPAEEKEPCNFQATDDCTPHVGPNGKVRVDALVWSVVNASTAPTIGDQQYGLGEKADGVFVIVKLNVKSEKDETATVASETVKLSDGQTTTEPDDEAGISVDDPLIFEEIGPDSTKTATLVFDIPPEKLSKKLELRFGELGFGSTEGFIRLPALG